MQWNDRNNNPCLCVGCCSSDNVFGNVRLIDVSGWYEHMEEAKKKLDELMQEFMVE